MSDLLKMKYNLIQNFYIIGLCPEDLFSDLSKENNKIKCIDIFNPNPKIELTPKIISKFPPINSNYNSIPNEIVINQCFPNGFRMIQSHKKDNITHFSFELDNLKYKHLPKNNSFYSKIYFNCLKIYEPIQDYQKIKSEINYNKKNDQEINIINNNIINDCSSYYIPKVICFASLLPFTKELKKILNNLYDYFLYYNTNMNPNNNSLINNLSPIEKVVEQIVMCLPFPIPVEKEYCISYKFNYPINSINSNSTVNTSISNLKNNLRASLTVNQTFPYNNTNINFPIYDPLKCFMNDLYSEPLNNIILYFNEEDMIKIIKYIILEVPVLFFSENIELLTQTIQGFLSLLQPFTYVQPHVSVLPSKFYGIINNESKFIFGVCENYSSNFFKNNNIILDKTIIVVNLLNNKPKIEEVKKLEDQKDFVIINNYNIFNYINNDIVLSNGAKLDVINIDFPHKPKKQLLSKLKSCLSDFKKKKDKNISEKYGHIFNQKIRYFFYKFYTKILSGYTDYLLKIKDYDFDSKDNKGFYPGDNIRYKINYNNDNSNNNQIKFIKSVFNMDEFISKLDKESHMFYRAFFNTKLFHNFIHEIIFSNDDQISLNHNYFNLITFLKKHKELKNDKEYKELLLQYNNLFNTKNDKKEEKSEPKSFLNILNDINYNLDEKKIMFEKNKQNIALRNYSQLINVINISSQNQNPINIISNNNTFNKQIFLKYFIFPKMLFDNEFFDINYDKLFFRHYLEMPSNEEIQSLNEKIKSLKSSNYDKCKKTIFPKIQNEPNTSSKTIIDLRRYSKIEQYSNNNNSTNQDVLVENYIEFNWLLLVSCSLWYCFNQVETEIRINKIFDVLEKIDFIEEQVLFFLYMTIYNFGTKPQFIKMFEFLNRFMGYSSYTHLIYLCLKINKIEVNKDKDEIIAFKNRSFLDINEIKENIKNENKNEIIESNKKENQIGENININSSIGNNFKKEEILFYTIQECPKCHKENKINNLSDLIHHRISQKRDNLNYKCSECGEDNIDVKIKYKLSLIDKKKNESIIVNQGQFKLIPPHKIYEHMKEYFIYLKDYKLDIDHIFSNDKIYLLNNIFYFSDRMLSFDFLIPYEGQEGREYFMEDEEEDEEEEKEKNDKNNKNSKNDYYVDEIIRFSFLRKD